MFVPGKPCLMFVGKTRDFLMPHKYETRLERLARNKHTSLSRKIINYGRKNFCNIGLWLENYGPEIFIVRACVR